MALYDLWKAYDEKKDIGKLLSIMPKPKTAPSRYRKQLPVTTVSKTYDFTVCICCSVSLYSQIACLVLFKY